jgi:type I restriction enzyme M protein
MEACVVVCRTRKTDARKGRVLFIDAVNEYSREQAQSFLRPQHIERILNAYKNFEALSGFSRVATVDEIRANGANLSIPLYVTYNDAGANGEVVSLNDTIAHWETGSAKSRNAIRLLIELLREDAPA